MVRLFVVGSSRGGTTLCQRLVADTFSLYTLPETGFFAHLVGDLAQRRFPQTAERPQGLRAATARLRIALGLSTGREYVSVTDVKPLQRPKWRPIRTITQDFVAALDAAARDANAAGWVEKTPYHVLYTAEIERLVDGAWVVHVVRAPQDVVGSIWDAACKYHDPWKIVYNRIERAVEDWNTATAHSAAMVGHDRHVFVPYDLMAQDPDRTMACIGARIGLRSTDTPKETRVIAKSSEAWKSGAMSGDIRVAESKWTTALDEDERRRAASLIRPVPDNLDAALQAFRAEVQGK